MKLSLDRESLLKPLQTVIGVVERKQTLPILSNVLLDLKDSKLSITGTDLEVELIGLSELEGQNENNKLTLPGRKLMDICKALPEGAPIELHQDKERVTLQSGRSRFVLATLPPADFPYVEDQDGQLTFSVPQNELRQLLNRTSFAMALQDVRYYLNGLLLEITPGKLTAVATDGHRLAMNEMFAPIDSSKPRVQIIVPRKGIIELMRLLEDADKEVTISIGNSHIRVISDQYTFTSKLVDGRFPDYSRVIPKNAKTRVHIERSTLKQALNRASILSNEKFHGICLEFRKNLLRLHANNPEQEVAEEELAIEYSGKDLDIGFNVNYLLDVLNTMNNETVTLCLADANSSILLEEADSNSLFVVMPMRL